MNYDELEKKYVDEDRMIVYNTNILKHYFRQHTHFQDE